MSDEGALPGPSVPADLRFGEDGLLPVVVQDLHSGDVLMVAYANAEALARTCATGLAHFWSRSRAQLWRKGETSGNVMKVKEILADCDRDALLFVAEPAGPACHTGTRSCFGDGSPTAPGIVEEIRRVIASRAAEPSEDSYTSRLLARGLDHILKKIGEEATEVVLAAKGESDERLAEESADLLFHLLALWHQRGLAPAQVFGVLRRRRRSSGVRDRQSQTPTADGPDGG
jgi:phosphoribosyl-AMP cyclohydrolase / phosphoribosyl-ATP pyrophosphohydrolase